MGLPRAKLAVRGPTAPEVHVSRTAAPAWLAVLLVGCNLYLPSPLDGKSDDQQFTPWEAPVPGQDTGPELPPQDPDTLIGELRYGQRSEALSCAFRWRVAGDRRADLECPSCDLRWSYELTYELVPEELSEDCYALPFVTSTAYSLDFLTDYFNTSLSVWMLGDRGGSPYFMLGGMVDEYYGYYGYPEYGDDADSSSASSYFRVGFGTYEVTEAPGTGLTTWDLSLGRAYYYYGYDDYGSDALEYYLGGDASAR